LSERFLKWAVRRYYRQMGLKVHLKPVKLGNVEIDGEVEGEGWKIALEIKTPRDDLTRGLGQLAEALAFGYTHGVLVTTLRNARRIDPKVFDKLGLVLLGIDSKGRGHELYPTYAALPEATETGFLR